jgi:hypothetical protein
VPQRARDRRGGVSPYLGVERRTTRGEGSDNDPLAPPETQALADAGAVEALGNTLADDNLGRSEFEHPPFRNM